MAICSVKFSAYPTKEQKVDVIIANDNSNLIEQEAITKGGLL